MGKIERRSALFDRFTLFVRKQINVTRIYFFGELPLFACTPPRFSPEGRRRREWHIFKLGETETQCPREYGRIMRDGRKLIRVIYVRKIYASDGLTSFFSSIVFSCLFCEKLACENEVIGAFVWCLAYDFSVANFFQA